MAEVDGTPLSGRDFEAELRAEEASRQAAGIPPVVARAVWTRLEANQRGDGRPRPARRSGRMLVLCAASVAVVVAVLVALRPAPRLGALEVARRSDDLVATTDAGLITIARGTATLFDPPGGLTIATSGAVSLRRDARGVRLVRGRIEVSATHRTAGAAPGTILVSDGAIEVMGTAFTVVQEQDRGRVTLHEGHIRFEASNGVVVDLQPGGTLAWPLANTQPMSASAANAKAPASSQLPEADVKATEPPSAPSPSSKPARSNNPARPSAKSAAVSTTPRLMEAGALLDRVEELRSRRQYEEAARALRNGIAAEPEPLRERLSFELGSLLTHQIGDPRRACAQWASHQRHFPDGRYRDEVARERRALGCSAAGSAP